MKIAAIDVGTNTIRCLLGYYEGKELYRDEIRREIIRLGGGLRNSGDISLPAATQGLALLHEYSADIKKYGAKRAWAVGTSALREASSAGRFRRNAAEALGFPLDVIDGEEEATLTAAGVQAGVGRIDDGIILDIGGGSTEIVRMVGGKEKKRESLPEGVVHLTERYLVSDPPTRNEMQKLRDFIHDLAVGLPLGGRVFVGTAGTPTTLAALDLAIDEYDPALVNGHVLSSERIVDLVETLSSMTTAQRLLLPGMEKGREDLIVTGAIMIEEFMRQGGYTELLVSDWGLLEGLAMECAVCVRGYDINKGE